MNFRHYPELRNRNVNSFEGHLRAIADFPPEQLNFHLRPQRLNLDFPRIDYDAIFYPEDLSALSRFFSEISPELILERSAPHARSAQSKLETHYTPRAMDLVREIYAEDFLSFGYSDKLEDVEVIPGTCIVGREIIDRGEERAKFLSRCAARPNHCTALAATLRFHRLAETFWLV